MQKNPDNWCYSPSFIFRNNACWLRVKLFMDSIDLVDSVSIFELINDRESNRVLIALNVVGIESNSFSNESLTVDNSCEEH